QGDRHSRISEIRVIAASDLRIEYREQPALRRIESGCAVSGTARRHHHVTSARKPHRGIAELHKWEEAAITRVEGHAVIHHRQRKRSRSDRTNHIGDRWKHQGQRPDFLLNRSERSIVRAAAGAGCGERHGHRDGGGHAEGSKHLAIQTRTPNKGQSIAKSFCVSEATPLIQIKPAIDPQLTAVSVTIRGPNIVSSTLPTA